MDKRLIAPVIISVCGALFYVFCAVMLFLYRVELWMTVLAVAFMLLWAVFSVYVMVERIREIRSGEEDDLGNY
ncbi:MAG: hypothetical protein LBE48_04115 [Methanomassiliicoccaceae archaeon]|jgi:phosphatidylglycerophosphate synthase|nr:hypothetical protein [Methanomassiliicoccaceae archaeon]